MKAQQAANRHINARCSQGIVDHGHDHEGRHVRCSRRAPTSEPSCFQALHTALKANQMRARYRTIPAAPASSSASR